MSPASISHTANVRRPREHGCRYYHPTKGLCGNERVTPDAELCPKHTALVMETVFPEIRATMLTLIDGERIAELRELVAEM